MNRNESVKPLPATAGRPYPWRCGTCRERAVSPAQVDYTVDVAHDGRKYNIKVAGLDVLKCAKCGELVLDAAANQRITNALRAKVGLLEPKDIRAKLEALGLTQKDFALRMGFAAETVSRWLTGVMIQSKAMDNLMRLYFEIPEARTLLEPEQVVAGCDQDRAELGVNGRHVRC